MGGAFPCFTESTAVPNDAEIEALWDRYGMLDNIRTHSEVVCAMALRLTAWLGEGGVPLVTRVVRAGALVHDLCKTPCLKSGRRHDREGEQLLREHGYPELGRLVGVHVNLAEAHPLDEAMVVYYADKRVNHDRVVGLDERFAYIAERYGRGIPAVADRVAEALQRAYRAERILFEHVGPSRSPADLGVDLPVIRLGDPGS